MALTSVESKFFAWTLLATDRWYLVISWFLSDEMSACRRRIVLMAVAGSSKQTGPILWTKLAWFCSACDDPCLRRDPGRCDTMHVFGKLATITMPLLYVLSVLAFVIPH